MSMDPEEPRTDPTSEADETAEARAIDAPTDPDQPESTSTGPTIPDVLPVMPLRGGTVVFPLAVVPLLVGQERSIKLIDDVMRGDRLVALVAQKSDTPELAGPEHIHEIGTAGGHHQLVGRPGGDPPGGGAG